MLRNLSNKFSAFILICLILSSSCISITYYIKTQKIIHDHALANTNREIDDYLYRLNTFLETISITLRDYANYPLIIQSVLQPESSKGKLADFMETFKVQGEKRNIVILDYEGNEVYSTIHAPFHNYESSKIKREIIDEGKSRSYLIKNIADDYEIVISVPVLVDGSAEGILLAEFSIDKLADIFMSDHEGNIDLITPDQQVIFSSGTLISKQHFSRTHPELDIAIRVSINEEKWIQQLTNLTNDILKIFIFSLMILIPIAYIIGNKFFIQRIRKVQEGADQIAKGKLDHKIYDSSEDEISLLATSFNKMTEQLSTAIGKIEEDKRNLNRIINTMIDTLIVLNPDGHVRYANIETSRLLGYASDELRELHYSNLILIPRSKGNFSTESLLEMVNNHDSLRDESIFLLSKNKTKIPANISCSAMRDSKDKITGIVLVGRDMTEAKVFQEIEKQAKELSKAYRELELANSDIRHQAKELELANKYKSDFLANISHELRTPLNSLLMLTKMLISNRDENLLNTQIEDLNIIHKSGSDLLLLINDILDLSRIESGEVEISLNRSPIRDIISDIDYIFSKASQERSIEFKIELSKDLPESIYTDAFRVQQILKNFLSNAFKFTKKGSVEINIYRADTEVCLTDRDKNKCQEVIAFSVSDTGIGIPKDKLEAIMIPFRQVDGSTTRKYGGTGLGLSISNKLTELLGGKLKVESSLGAGSTFTIYLPLTEIAQEADIFDKTTIKNEY